MCEVSRTNNKSSPSSLGIIYQVQTAVNIEIIRTTTQTPPFNMVITTNLTHASGTWTLSKEHDKLIRMTQRKMLRLIVQTLRKYKNKSEEKQRRKKTKSDEEPTNVENDTDDKGCHQKYEGDTEEGNISNTDRDQDNEVSS